MGRPGRSDDDGIELLGMGLPRDCFSRLDAGWRAMGSSYGSPCRDFQTRTAPVRSSMAMPRDLKTRRPGAGSGAERPGFADFGMDFGAGQDYITGFVFRALAGFGDEGALHNFVVEFAELRTDCAHGDYERVGREPFA